MVVGSALPLVHVDDAVQIGEVAVQIDPLCVTAADEPVLDVSRLGGGTGDDVDTYTRVKGSETATEPSRRVCVWLKAKKLWLMIAVLSP